MYNANLQCINSRQRKCDRGEGTPDTELKPRKLIKFYGHVIILNLFIIRINR